MALKPCNECKKEISTEAKTCPNCGKKNPTAAKQSSTMAVGCLVILVAFTLLGRIGGGGSRSEPEPPPVVIPPHKPNANPSAPVPEPTPPPPANPEPPPRRSKSIVMQHVKLDYGWEKGGFDNVMMAHFTFINPNDVAIKDIEVTCSLFAPSGTLIDANRKTVFEVVSAKGRKTVREFNMGFMNNQATKASCEITDLQLIQ